MPASKTVILGEAPESDSEEISLNDEEIYLETAQDHQLNQVPIRNHASAKRDAFNAFEGTSSGNKESDNNNKTVLGSSLLASIGSACGITKLVNYNLLAQSQPLSLNPEQMQTADTIGLNQLPPLHKNLYTKNYQLYASMHHLYNHPYEKASKDLHTISQRLVAVQKIFQDVDSAVMKIKREQKTLDNMDLQLIQGWQDIAR